jgi:hypothetical protein
VAGLPLTRPISITIHEPVFPLLQQVAEEDCNGNISEHIRLLIYADLVTRGKLNGKLLKELG